LGRLPTKPDHIVSTIAVAQEELLAVMALRRADAAVAVIEIVAMHEVARPVASSIEIGEARVGELRGGPWPCEEGRLTVVKGA
jgi:hypothetical protein